MGLSGFKAVVCYRTGGSGTWESQLTPKASQERL